MPTVSGFSLQIDNWHTCLRYRKFRGLPEKHTGYRASGSHSRSQQQFFSGKARRELIRTGCSKISEYRDMIASLLYYAVLLEPGMVTGRSPFISQWPKSAMATARMEGSRML